MAKMLLRPKHRYALHTVIHQWSEKLTDAMYVHTLEELLRIVTKLYECDNNPFSGFRDELMSLLRE